jgi:hypothetical protein
MLTMKQANAAETSISYWHYMFQFSKSQIQNMYVQTSAGVNDKELADIFLRRKLRAAQREVQEVKEPALTCPNADQLSTLKLYAKYHGDAAKTKPMIALFSKTGTIQLTGSPAPLLAKVGVP